MAPISVEMIQNSYKDIAVKSVESDFQVQPHFHLQPEEEVIQFTTSKVHASGVSQRRAALAFGSKSKTVERKLPFLARRCRKLNHRHL